MAEILGSMLTGVTFYCWIFFFPHSKTSDANVANFVCVSEKLDRKVTLMQKVHKAMEKLFP